VINMAIGAEARRRQLDVRYRGRRFADERGAVHDPHD